MSSGYLFKSIMAEGKESLKLLRKLLLLPLVSQTRLRPNHRLKCKSELFQFKETCTN